MLGTFRNSTLCGVAFSLAALVLLFLLIVQPRRVAPSHREKQAAMRAQVSNLQLTDLCLYTEARYTRHLSQADLHSAFQDHPLALDHFPSGSLVVPPGQLRDVPDRALSPVSDDAPAVLEQSQ